MIARLGAGFSEGDARQAGTMKFKKRGAAMADHTERLPEIAKAEIVIGTYPDPNSPDGRGALVIKGPRLYSKIASGRTPILWIECNARGSTLKTSRRR
jgi:hypothetical protein